MRHNARRCNVKLFGSGMMRVQLSERSTWEACTSYGEASLTPNGAPRYAKVNKYRYDDSFLQLKPWP